jgi:hypothetical protein
MRELVRGDGDDPSNSTPGDAVVGEEGASILAQYRQIASGELQAMPCKLPEVYPQNMLSLSSKFSTCACAWRQLSGQSLIIIFVY